MVVLLPEVSELEVAAVLHNIAGLPAIASLLATRCNYSDICITSHGVKHIEKVMEVSIADLLAGQGLDESFNGDILLLPFSGVLYLKNREYRVKTSHPECLGVAPYIQFGQNKSSWKKV